MDLVFSQLKRMAGSRERCMFCEDSRGVDIDHFWPKSKYPERTFAWENLVLTCSGCNRDKGVAFELAPDGSPLLINPTKDDPWTHLFYDSHTGIVTARFVAALRGPDPRGHYTVERSRLPLNIQAVTDGRQCTQRNLMRCVRRYTESVNATTNHIAATGELLACVNDNSQYGLASWFFLRDGQDEQPFALFRSKAPDIWTLITDHLGKDLYATQ
jgi:uncharacterized protein (TIGR02646 family)